MRSPVRWLIAPLLAGLLLATGMAPQNGGEAGVSAQPAPQPRIVMVDNNGSFMPGDPLTGLWTFSPAHITVMQGETIIVDNPMGNARAHTITSLVGSGPFTMRTITVGEAFDSGNIMPGNSYTLETATLIPGHYGYLCRLHEWMVGSFTVMAP